MKKPELSQSDKILLSIIILNHNTKDLTLNCLASLEKVRNEIPFEIILSDNASTDGSVDAIREKFPLVKITTGPNISFSNGNNRARKLVQGKYVLLLNSDTIMHKNTLKESIAYMTKSSNVGALTCKLLLPNGELDKDVRRRFPTPWVTFKRFFLRMARDYWYLDISPDIIHEVDAIQGAYFLTTKKILDQVGWLDENYVFDGEDLDLSYQIKKHGYKIIYFPKVSATHIKKATKRDFRGSERKMQGVNSMEYFVRKNLWNNYPLAFNYFLLTGIRLLKTLRFLRIPI